MSEQEQQREYEEPYPRGTTKWYAWVKRFEDRTYVVGEGEDPYGTRTGPPKSPTLNALSEPLHLLTVSMWEKGLFEAVVHIEGKPNEAPYVRFILLSPVAVPASVMQPEPIEATTEAVDHPAHYGGADNPYETIKVLRAWLSREEYIGAMKFNVIKYVSRLGKKAGADSCEDARKAGFYLNELIALLSE